MAYFWLLNDLTDLMNYTYGLCEDGNYDTALEYFDAILKQDSRNVKIITDKGITLAHLERFDEAIVCYDEILRLEPENIVALVNKGAALHGLEKYDGAIKCYDKVLSDNKNDAMVLTYKGLALGETGRLREALWHFERALEIDGKYDIAINNRETALELIKKCRN